MIRYLYRSKETDEIVLIDFGMSHRYRGGNQHSLRDRVGTSYYIAPEVLEGNYSAVCDMWSLGVIAFMMLSGHAPFGGSTDHEIMRNVARGAYDMHKAPWRSVSEQCKTFVRGLLTRETDRRMTPYQAIHHPWMMFKHHDPNFRLSECEVDQLKLYVSFPELKRRAMNIIAYYMSYEDRKEKMGLFDKIDNDQNGVITLRELRPTIEAKYADLESIQRIFQAINLEGTGVIYCNDFVAAFIQRNTFEEEGILHHAFGKLGGASGYIDVDSLKPVLGNEYSVDKAQYMLHEALKLVKTPQKRRMSIRGGIRLRISFAAFREIMLWEPNVEGAE